MDGLKKQDVFKGLANAVVDAVVKSGSSIRLRPKNILFHQGNPAKACYLVNRGRLKLTKLNEEGKEIILRYIGAEELTAAIAVFKGWTYPVTAESIEETDITGWSKPVMMELMRRYPDISINLLGIILERIVDMQDRYLEICTEQVDQRIARSLLRIMRKAGSKTEEGIHIDIPLSRQNIADYSGTTLYTVSRTLSSWEKKGWIQSGREQIVVTDPHAMVQFAETGLNTAPAGHHTRIIFSHTPFLKSNFVCVSAKTSSKKKSAIFRLNTDSLIELMLIGATAVMMIYIAADEWMPAAQDGSGRQTIFFSFPASSTPCCLNISADLIPG